MKLSPWKTKTFKLGCFYYTVTHSELYGNGLHCIYEEDYNEDEFFYTTYDEKPEDYWVDVSDLTEMKIWEFEKLNKLLLENFGFTADVSGNLTKEV